MANKNPPQQNKEHKPPRCHPSFKKEKSSVPVLSTLSEIVSGEG